MKTDPKTTAPIQFETGEEFLTVKLTEAERSERASQAAELFKRAREARSNEARLKMEAADAKKQAESASNEGENLMGVYRSGTEERRTETETLYDDLTGDLVKYRTDTGAELARRKPNEGDRLKLDAKRQRVLDLDGARKQKVDAAVAATAKKEPVSTFAKQEATGQH